MTKQKKRAPRNRTITLDAKERTHYSALLRQISGPVTPVDIRDTVLHHDLFDILDWLPGQAFDLLFLDPPYNLSKAFNQRQFNAMSSDAYEAWLESWFPPLLRTLKPSASVYLCADWRSSAAVQRVLERHLIVRNRITWEREKGRGAKANWKNCAEDIWFATVSNDYTFNVEAVKLRRQVRAPYTTAKGQPKDWQDTPQGRFRDTHPSNVWTDLTVPFWSMPENTDHPTQKPEKLLARVLLASSNPGATVLDPFAGVGTTAVTAKKLGRHFTAVEIDEEYGCLTQKRLALAEQDATIQGYAAGVFWERNVKVKREI